MNNNEAMQYHIRTLPGDVGEFVLLPGDPARAEAISRRFDNPVHIASNREFTTYTGSLAGRRVSVTSTGIGGASAVIAMEELIKCGARYFIRVGTCGGINLDVCAGDIVIASAAVRAEGTSREYAPIEYPAAADFALTRCLSDSAAALGYRAHVGVVQNKDSFYGQHSPDTMPVAAMLNEKWEAWKRLGVLASEMESAALFCCAAARHVSCASVLHVCWNQERRAAGIDPESLFSDEPDRAIDVALRAVTDFIKE